jgi:hypothetical protein
MVIAMTATVEKVADQDGANELLRCLSESEIETAARTSYAYFKQKSQQGRLFHACEMARRYLESAQKDKALALERIRNTLNFRKEKKLDDLREALDDPVNYYHKELKHSLSSGHVYVQGHDREGRSTYIFIPRRVQSHDPELTMASHLWTMEKAIACSRAKDGTINAVVDFRGFSAFSHTPPTCVGKELMTTLRNHYVGHINSIFLLDAPTTFFCLWTIFKPFAGRKTRDKIHFISTPEERNKLLGTLYDRDQATPWMLPNGGKTRELDIEEYIDRLPFDQAFDE